MFAFRLEKSLEERQLETQKIQTKWPGKVPIILEKDPKCTLENLEKKKYICSQDYTVQQFLSSIRKKLRADKSVGIFVFLNGKELLSGDSLLNEIYHQKKDEDGFLYMMYSEHEVLG